MEADMDRTLGRRSKPAASQVQEKRKKGKINCKEDINGNASDFSRRLTGLLCQKKKLHTRDTYILKQTQMHKLIQVLCHE
jgi:hypothetical protein